MSYRMLQTGCNFAQKIKDMNGRFNITAEAGGEGRLDIFGRIGEDWWAEDPEENTAKRISERLDALKECSSVTVRINSLGGDVDTALAVHALLKECRNVTTEAVGMVASAATIIFMAGGERKINKAALFLVHKCSSRVSGNEDALEEELEAQRTVNDTMAEIYNGAGVSRATVDELMGANHGEGKWITAKEAKQYGFATAVVDGTKRDAEARRVWSAEDLAEEGLPMTGGLVSRLRELFRAWQREDNNTNTTDMKEKESNQTPAGEENTQTPQEEQQTPTAEECRLAAELEAAIAERDRKTAENEQLRARVAELEAVVAETPAEGEQPNGDDTQAGEGKESFADWQKKQGYYQEVEAEVNRRRMFNN